MKLVRLGIPLLRNHVRFLSTSRPVLTKRVEVKLEGDSMIIEALPTQESTSKKLEINDPHGSCPLCRLNVEVKYHDILILRQFMREDGTVLPMQITGLCPKQQTIVERCVMQGHLSGLYTSRENKGAGYRKYKNYWESHRELHERKLPIKDGSWYYIRKYNRY